MQDLYTNHKRITNQYNNAVMNCNLSQVPKKMRIEKIISDDLIQTFGKYYNKILGDYDVNHYNTAQYVIKKMQDQGIETLDHTDKLDPLYKLCIINHIDQKIKDFHEFPNISSYKVIDHTICKAKESGIDIERYQNQLSRLEKEGKIGTLHQKIQACIVNDSMQNILGLQGYIKELIASGIYIGHQAIKEQTQFENLYLYTVKEKNGILENINKHAVSYQQTNNIDDLNIIFEEIFLAGQLGIDVDIIPLAQTLGLPIQDYESQQVYVNSLLDNFKKEIDNNEKKIPITKEEIKRLSTLITIFS